MNTKDIEDLAKRLKIKADMIAMGEGIKWGSDSEIMREAADALTTLTQHHEAEVESAVEEERERILAEISNCQQEHNIARHGDTVDEIYDRVHDYIKFTTAPTKTDKQEDYKE